MRKLTQIINNRGRHCSEKIETDKSSVDACDLAKKADIKRLENVFSSSTTTLQITYDNQTSKIFEAIDNIQVTSSTKPANTSPDKSSVTIHQLEDKMRSLKIGNQSIEFKLPLGKVIFYFRTNNKQNCLNINIQLFNAYEGNTPEYFAQGLINPHVSYCPEANGLSFKIISTI